MNDNDYKIIYLTKVSSNEFDMLKTHINKMLICEDLKELKTIINFARIKLENIYDYQQIRLQEKGDV